MFWTKTLEFLKNNVALNKLVIKVLINILPDTKTLPKPIIELKIFLTPEIFAAILPCTICLKPKLWTIFGFIFLKILINL